jgi:hypothetical protein
VNDGRPPRQPDDKANAQIGFSEEPELVAKTHAKRMCDGTCIKLKDPKDEVAHTANGNISLCPCVDLVAEPVSEVVPTPETVV